MKKRIFSNYITTIFGLIILLFCMVMLYEQKYNVEELSGWLAVGLLFLRSKDSLIGLPPK